MVRGRPRSDDPRARTVSVKFSGEEGDVFDRLVEAWKQEMREHGGEATASSVMRALVLREAKARGLVGPAKATTKKKGTKR